MNSLSIISESLNMITEFIKNKDKYESPLNKTKTSKQELNNWENLKKFDDEKEKIIDYYASLVLNKEPSSNSEINRKISARKKGIAMFEKYKDQLNDSELRKQILDYSKDEDKKLFGFDKLFQTSLKGPVVAQVDTIKSPSEEQQIELESIFGKEFWAEYKNEWNYSFESTKEMINKYLKGNAMSKEAELQLLKKMLIIKRAERVRSNKERVRSNKEKGGGKGIIVGSSVTWLREDNDIKKGEVGLVDKVLPNGKEVIVHFPRGGFTLPITSLKLAK